MESHFRNEDRQLLTVLETLELDADVGSVLGHGKGRSVDSLRSHHPSISKI